MMTEVEIITPNLRGSGVTAQNRVHMLFRLTSHKRSGWSERSEGDHFSHAAEGSKIISDPTASPRSADHPGMPAC
jgi:hypothetical protein